MRNIQNEIRNSLKVLESFKIDNYSIDSVGIGTRDSKDYDQLAEDALKISADHREAEGTIFVRLKEKVEEVQYVRISKPVSKNDVSLIVKDLDEARKIYPDAEYAEWEGWKLLTLTLDEGKIYISDHSEAEYHFKDSAKKEGQQEAKVEESNGDLSELEKERAARLSLMADFQNFQKRVQDEKATWGAMSNMALIKDILEVNDDLQFSMDDENLTIEQSKSSIKSAQDKLIESIKRAGVEKVEVKIGDEFDKEKMEAVSTVNVEDENLKGKVIAVISSAYKYSNKEFILKAAKVVVGK